jgi:hypothetical protein
MIKRLKGLKNTVNKYMADIRPDRLTTCQSERKSVVSRRPCDSLFFILDCEATGTAATPGLLCQPRVVVKMIVEKQMECRLAGEIEVLGENLPQRHFCPSQNPT